MAETDQDQIAALLEGVEAHLRELELWARQQPEPAAFQSQQPFFIDTLAFPQWLQFVFLPRIDRMLADGERMPPECNIAPMAEEYLRTEGIDAPELVRVLGRLDVLISRAP